MATLKMSQQRWLPGQSLHKVKSVQDIPARKKRRSPAPSPAKELLAVNGPKENEDQFSLKLWPLVGYKNTD